MINYNSFKEIQDLEKEYAKEKSLWKAVIFQAFADMLTQSKKYYKKNLRVKAILWFNINNKDFNQVCAYADVKPTKIIKIANQIKEGKFNNNLWSKE